MTFELVLIALGCSLEPLPLTAYILTLSTKAGIRNGFAFIAGWLLTLAVVVALTVIVTGGKPLAPSSAPSDAVLVARILLGLGLLAFAWQFHRRPPKPPKEPAWMKRFDDMSVWSAASLALLLQPWPLVVAATVSITQANTRHAGDLVGLAAFMILATITYAGMQAYAVRSPEAARVRLDELRAWIDGHRKPMITGLAIAVGAILVTRAALLLHGTIGHR